MIGTKRRLYGPADEVNGRLPNKRDNFSKLDESLAEVGLDAKDTIVFSRTKCVLPQIGIGVHQYNLISKSVERRST